MVRTDKRKIHLGASELFIETFWNVAVPFFV
jgi:hypothetical protein